MVVRYRKSGQVLVLKVFSRRISSAGSPINKSAVCQKLQGSLVSRGITVSINSRWRCPPEHPVSGFGSCFSIILLLKKTLPFAGRAGIDFWELGTETMLTHSCQRSDMSINSAASDLPFGFLRTKIRAYARETAARCRGVRTCPPEEPGESTERWNETPDGGPKRLHARRFP